jgi:hypothetical protein
MNPANNNENEGNFQQDNLVEVLDLGEVMKPMTFEEVQDFWKLASPEQLEVGATRLLAAIEGARAAEMPLTDWFFEMGLPMPPSTNNLYATVRGRRVLSDEGRTYKERLGWLIHAKYPDFSIPERTPLEMQLTLFFPAHLVNGSDTSNRIKIIEDAIVEASRTKANDHWIYDLVVRKRISPNGNNYCAVRLRPLAVEELEWSGGNA